jgi:hypothetical protein
MVIATDQLPTHLALVARRLNAIGPDDSANSFLLASYLAEATIKTVNIVLYHGLASSAPDVAYRYAHSFVRSDGLGEWDQSLRSLTANNVATFLPPDFRPLMAWATKKRSGEQEQAFRDAYTGLVTLLEQAGGDVEASTTPRTIRDLITLLVQVRNKTKAHGAWGPEFYQQANEPYIAAIRALLSNCPAVHWDWMHLAVRGAKTRGMWAKGEGPRSMPEADVVVIGAAKAGLYFRTDKLARPYWCGDLIPTDHECRQAFLPNGGHDGNDKAEFLDYATPEHRLIDVTAFSRPPAPLPASETEGLDSIDIQSNVFGNLPDLPRGYVERPQLQAELHERLMDQNHTVITLHGRGGIGKTSLALFALHQLAATARFEYILWFSARDLDLRAGGPVQVRQAVADLRTVCKQFGRLFSGQNTPEAFASILQDPKRIGSYGILFVFDNFETLDDLVGLHKFLDTHTHLPNKVLITSRERAFKGDFPIEVRGMERPEAMEMLRQVGRQLAIEGLLTDKVRDDIFERTDGHPYVMRMILGELAKGGSTGRVPVKQLLPYRGDVINVVFERSFNKLTPEARWVFLCVANWRSAVTEVALIVILSQRDIDVEAGIDECQRLSLINRNFSDDGQPYYFAPELARTFGRKKLEGDPDKLAIEESLEWIRSFGVMASGKIGADDHNKQIRRFLTWCMEEASRSPQRVEKLDALLARLADFSPAAWLKVAEFRQTYQRPRQDIEYAFRRAVEESPGDIGARLARAGYAHSVGDETTRISSLVSAVELDPANAQLVWDAAGILADYLTKQKYVIPRSRRGGYLASVRTAMERMADRLDATGLSRLAWLYLLENNETEARKYAARGLRLEPTNQACQRLLHRLTSSPPGS